MSSKKKKKQFLAVEEIPQCRVIFCGEEREGKFIVSKSMSHSALDVSTTAIKGSIVTALVTL